MKLTIQRVKYAKVFKDEELISESKFGYLLLVCFKRGESDNLVKIAKKTLSYKLFDNWTKNIQEIEGDIMVLSQFTLTGKIKGTKPSFHESEEHFLAKNKFTEFIKILKENYFTNKVFSGIFGFKLEIETKLDGPCTIQLEIN
ncbi:Dtd1p [Tubulinosema ratisbonensis]|uniref:D-aminoacyl-tRNA deacylase n=1 Tax=Tubulinosema ratisbonensis TaxID=291195 RepID=A0A437ALN1_9MICR|nr:Dtd1p [Tubulinosema ratisbonensis]